MEMALYQFKVKLKMNLKAGLILLILIHLFLSGICQVVPADSCDANTPKFTFNLSGNPDSLWVSPRVRRTGLCCQLPPNASPPIRCVQFFFTLDTAAQGIIFDIETGAKPPGALGYSINCGEMHQVGDAICLSGPGPHWLTFCKPGNNPNTYSIKSYPKPRVSPPIVVSDGCTGRLSADGFILSSIIWSSVPNNPTHNSYLNCTRACSTVVATYERGAPPYVDYQVKGIPMGGCATDTVIKTTRVYFVDDKLARIEPENPTVCFGNNTTTITANITGGMPPYTYLWSTGETTQSINVGVGKYSVVIQDNTSCPPASDTVVVTEFTLPIEADAGRDTIMCSGDSLVTLRGSVQAASGGRWSGGQGTYLPHDSSLTITYRPTSAELAAGSFKLYLTTTGNGSCTPHTDSVNVNVIPSTPIAGEDKSICEGSSSVLRANLISGAKYEWFLNQNKLSDTNFLNISNVNAKRAYLVTMIDANNCRSNDSVFVSVFPPPQVTLPDLNTCLGDTTMLNTTLGNATTSGGTFRWFKDGTELSNTTGSLRIYENGRYWVIYSFGECFGSDTADASFYPIQAFAGTDTILCSQNAVVNLSGRITPSMDGFWTGGQGSFSPHDSSLTAQYTPTQEETNSGSVELILRSKITGNCTPATDTMVIYFRNPNPINIPNDTVCINSSLTITAPFLATSQYNWQLNGTTVSTTNILSINNIQNESTYVLSVVDNNQCEEIDSVIIATFPPPSINLRDNIACFGDNVYLNGTPSNLPRQSNASGRYTWFRNGAQLPFNSDSISVKDPGLYEVRFAIGNCEGKDTTSINFFPHPKLDLPPFVKFCREMEGSVVLEGGPYYRFLWLPSGNTGQALQVFEKGIYYLTVFDINNCFATDSIEVKEVCPPRIYVPNIFTPEQDKNNFFKISGANLRKFNLTIFNRWGEIIFYTENREDSWDGTYKGELMPIGVYAWLITYEGITEEHKGPFKMTGSVTLVR